jgi:tetratricopeptide (TPR) repeat protein
MYQEFLERQPDSKYAAQSLYAMGWIYEHELADNRQALAAYKKLIETYPESPMARHVRPKVTSAEQPAKLAAAPPDSPQTVPPDSGQFTTPDSLETAPPDSEQIATPVIEDEMQLKTRPKNIPSEKSRVLIDDELDRPQQDQGKKVDEPSKKDEEKKDVPPPIF